MIATLSFYLFATLAILSAILVVFARNPVHSVLWLIVTFFNAAGLMILLGAEFIAILVILVYVGAVAVLFLFIVMMLDIDFAALRSGFTQNLPFGILIALVLLSEMAIAVIAGRSGPVIAEAPPETGQSNIEAFGELLYSRFLVPFELSGLILLVALIGAVVLTHRSRGDQRPQKISKQVARDPKEAIQLKQPESGKGVEL
ncbi:NADH-quinone oxidoreductase subunit J [Sphingomicrobium sediminis]|uniref:NADH-quinone oxidoreductase subunit J n=1 Tax=Sphingomicrobium sediminis TaxID=2950949 RepID=A0A9X2J4A3_9SPHN|nr:NADH-quinone oxidoreductase subunit J [Sphingomicrobium sediminis]MCM8557022.1 NADH-quinone oxidoreductase subunit J [Sphingomicrobium sediminis]